MTGQTRHHAARNHDARPDAGLPGPGQALIGYPEPPSSLFGVPLFTAHRPGPGEPAPRPPRPRTALDDFPVRPAPRRRRWPQVLGFPLAVLLLGVALGVIAVVMLVAAGVPAPWAIASTAPPPAAASMPGQHSAPPAGKVSATGIVEDGVYRVGSELAAGRYVTEGGVSCHWARLRDSAGTRTIVAEGNGDGRTMVWIRKADTAFETTGCTTWTRR